MLAVGDPFVGTEHMVLALVRGTDDAAAEIITRYGFTHAAGLARLDAIRIKPERSGG